MYNCKYQFPAFLIFYPNLHWNFILQGYKLKYLNQLHNNETKREMCFAWCLIALNKILDCKISRKPCKQISKKSCYCNYKNIHYKRYFLPFVGILVLVFFKQFHEFYYLPFIIGIAFFILFWNFPILINVTASKPLYYEDLFIDDSKLPTYDVTPKLKNKIQYGLEITLIITNCILAAVLSDYWLYKTSNIKNFPEILGITGGIIKIFQTINNIIGRLMLSILKRYIEDENKQFQSQQIESIRNIITLKKTKFSKSCSSMPNRKLIELSNLKSISNDIVHSVENTKINHSSKDLPDNNKECST